MTERREERIKNMIDKRQVDLTVILENVHDPHNLGAVLRTCDAVGIDEIFLLITNKRNYKRGVPKIGKTTSCGTYKWVKVNVFYDAKACFEVVRKRYAKIFGTHLSKDAVSLYQLNLVESVALVFGNEKLGITEETLSLLDGNFLIPQMGMVQSLNISVACAVSVYEACRQRVEANNYDTPLRSVEEREEVFNDYYEKEMCGYPRPKGYIIG